MTGELDQIVAGVAMRTREGRVQPTIDGLAVGFMERGESGAPGRMCLEASDDPSSHVECPRPLSRMTARAARPGGWPCYDRIRKHEGELIRPGWPVPRLGLRPSVWLLPACRRRARLTSTIAFAVRFCAPASITAAGCWRCCSQHNRG